MLAAKGRRNKIFQHFPVREHFSSQWQGIYFKKFDTKFHGVYKGKVFTTD